jgi:hypothetical protein
MAAAAPLTTHPLNNQFISSINYEPPPNQPQSPTKPQFIVVLDRSGSMRDSVRRIVTEILPIMFNHLSYDMTDKIHLLTFSDDDEYHLLPIDQLTSMTTFDQGGTCMFPAVRRLTEIFQQLQEQATDTLRILAISDGLISDQDKTEEAAGELARLASGSAIAVNSQAVRWEQPSADTRALCSLLQLNNVNQAQMVDTKLASGNGEIGDTWARLFMDDGLAGGSMMSSNMKVFLRHPWDEQASEKIRLQRGANTVWMTQVPSDVKVNDAPVSVGDGGQLDYRRLYELMREKYDYVVNQMKVHKVVSTKESVFVMQRIVTYFRRVEVEVPAPAGAKKFSKLLEDIANDRNVAHMSPEELKKYLEPRDVAGEMKPGGGEVPKVAAVKNVAAAVAAPAIAPMTPEQLAEVLRSFGVGSMMVLMLQQPKGDGSGKTCGCHCKCSCPCHMKGFCG